MPNIRNISGKQMLQFFLKEGFVLHHQKGSHIQLKKEDFHITIPNHGKKILKVATTLSILKQAGIEKAYFLAHVK